jgi:hypothetical protein
LKIAFIVWFGTHAEYDKIDAKTLCYQSSDIKDRTGVYEAYERIYSLINSLETAIETDSPEGEDRAFIPAD